MRRQGIRAGEPAGQKKKREAAVGSELIDGPQNSRAKQPRSVSYAAGRNSSRPSRRLRPSSRGRRRPAGVAPQLIPLLAASLQEAASGSSRPIPHEGLPGDSRSPADSGSCQAGEAGAVEREGAALVQGSPIEPVPQQLPTSPGGEGKTRARSDNKGPGTLSLPPSLASATPDGRFCLFPCAVPPVVELTGGVSQLRFCSLQRPGRENRLQHLPGHVG